MNLSRSKAFNIFLYTFLLMTACHQDKEEKRHADVSQVQLTLNADRFEQDLFNLRNQPGFISSLKNKYKEFFNLYCYHLTSVGTPDTILLANRLQSFTSDSGIAILYNESQKLYKDFSPIDKEITEGFRYYTVYFPGKPIPRIITYISGITGTSDFQTVNDSALIGIALDMYLGQQAPYYSDVNYPKYKSRTFSKEYIATDCMKGWLQSDYEADINQNDLLSEMIYEGKILYCLDQLMPQSPDSIKLHYTSQQVEWCKKNEQDVWAFFVEKKLLYETDQSKIMNFVTEGPTTNGFPKESPGHIGQWLGWNIIRAYMANNPQVSLPQLLSDKDYKKIFRESKYKPA